MTGPFKGTLHDYAPRLTAFEFDDGAQLAENVLVFIGGLTDGLLTVPYVPNLAASLSKETNSKWVVAQALITSSYDGWGTGSLARDVEELSLLVKYLRSNKGGQRKKIVLMGHLTGCQDTITYLSKLLVSNDDQSIQLDGAILQAPVSDSEAFGSEVEPEKLNQLLAELKDLLDKGQGDTLLPDEWRKLMLNTPINAYRFHSLVSKRGDDDYFSSYLDKSDFEKSFSVVKTPILVLYGEKDESVPSFVDREKLVDSWRQSTDPKYWSPLSKVLKGATHNCGPGSDKGAEEDLIQTVLKFISNI